LSTKKTLVFSSQYGEFSILLHYDRTPVTCQYFCDLVRNGGLSESSVFRIVSDRNQQPEDSCPIRVVQIGPIHNIFGDRHLITQEGTNLSGLSHRKWTVSAARFDSGELYGSFFICMRDEAELDFGGCRQPDGQGFAAFGQIIEGFKTLERIYQQAECDEMLTNEIPILDVSLTESSIDLESGCHNGA
jgi:peptidyl-prolyl cis-trans isomerase A (cyclophilin A)